MRIKALQLFGFKSFGDRTELTFDRQVVGVVGPNGCGKSNIVDAIRWAMGEQSAKGLRGNEMADVIFNGTATRKRANFAEVSLMFDNNQGLAPAPYNECAEIMITRRLFRSGESEYLINKVTVRLKDITDLFLGTGSSARAYSIVAQGKVDQIVLAKPEDRRFLLEEAAGIAKYKVRKLAAERKMEATQENLARIQDITGELERNARSLERQVEKAEQFRKLQTELRQLDEQIVSAKIARLEKAANQNDQARSSAQMEFESSSQQLLKLETEIETMRLEALNQEKLSAGDYENLIGTKEKFANADKESELRAQRISNLKFQIEERRKDIERLQSKTEANRDVLKQMLDERERLQSSRLAEEEKVGAVRKDLDQVQAGIQSLEAQAQALRDEIDAKKAIQIREESKREVLQSEKVELELKRVEMERSLEDFVVRKSAQDAESFSIAVQLEESEAERMHAEANLKELEALERSLVQDQSRILRELSSTRDELSQCDAEISNLESLEQHEVGYDQGALDRKKRTGQGLLLDLIEFKPEYSTVAAGFFNEFGQDFLEGDFEDSASLRWNRIGGSLKVEHPRTLFEAVATEPSPEICDFLKSIELVDRLSDTATTHIQIDSRGFIQIPLGAGYGRASLGEIQKKDSPFSRKLQIQEAMSKKAQLEVAVVDFESQYQSLGQRLREGTQSIHDVRQKIRDLLMKIQGIAARRAQQAAQAESLERRMTEVRSEVEQLDIRILEVSNDLSDFSVETSWAEQQKFLEDLVLKLTAEREKKAQKDSQWIEMRIAFGALIERLERLEQQTIDQEMTKSEYEHNQGLYQSDISNWTGDIAKEELLIQELKTICDSSHSEGAQLEMRLADSKARLSQLRSQVDQADVRRKELQASKDERQKLVQDLELTHQRLKFEVEELSQIVQERYHISLAEILQNVNLADLERLEDETILGSLEVDATEIRRKLEKFGDVNLLALTEYEDIKKRLDFMNTQREDLLKTLDALQSIILRINKITEFRFRETFTAINHNFQLLFPKLFGGGKAYMTLTDEKNLLETGVEIFAEPPGKKVQAMSLLSGGEKAMTSISLIFALFAYRPASFCILDEVDAPLDEVNTVRYNSIVAEMSALSQFIVITHNKRTMEVAEKLFGVTMQDPGVSQLVAVELKEAQALAS